MSVMAEVKKLREVLTASRRDAINSRPRQPEKLDPTPLEVPVGLQGPPSTRELVQQYVREQMSLQAQTDDLGTFEEEDDFEEENPHLLDLSGYEVVDYEMEEIDPQEDASPPSEAAAEPQPDPPSETETEETK